MELTKREMEIADRCLSKREKQLAQWPLRRWLLVAIFSVVTLLGYRIASDGERDINDDKVMDAAADRAFFGQDPPPELEHRWAIGSMMKLSKVLQLRHREVTYSLMQVAVGSMWTLSGVIAVCLVILRWNTGERDALICKLLRAKLQELEQAAAPNSRPPSQSPGPPEVQPSDSQRTTAFGGGG
jgi:hypothetical protein